MLGCSPLPGPAPSASPSILRTPSASASALPSARPAASCHARPDGGPLLVLPDTSCTPGALNLDVTPATQINTICRPGWTKTIRPPVAYTDALKRQQMAEYGFTDAIGRHEEDHLVALELGGSPRDPANLWPQPGTSPNPKDSLENRLHEMVCAGQVPLPVAQRDIAVDWVAALAKYGVPAA